MNNDFSVKGKSFHFNATKLARHFPRSCVNVVTYLQIYVTTGATKPITFVLNF